jgi:hypothetical protein
VLLLLKKHKFVNVFLRAVDITFYSAALEEMVLPEYFLVYVLCNVVNFPDMTELPRGDIKLGISKKDNEVRASKSRVGLLGQISNIMLCKQL